MAESVRAYDVGTHFELSGQGALKSVLGQGSVLSDLGLKPLTDTTQLFPSANGAARTGIDLLCHRGTLNILDLVRCGAQFEDIPGSRSVHHFFDPQNGGRALTLSLLGAVGTPSPDWSLTNRDQGGSYANAREYFLQALTAPSATDRSKHWGRTFQSLGQVIHHLQDMAQPQHVRNDGHCDAVLPCLVPGLLLGAYRPSKYEFYAVTSLDRVRTLATTGDGSAVYPGAGDANVGVFNTPRKFFIGNERGIAEHASRGFVSEGTNFVHSGGVTRPHPVYPLPVPGNPGPVLANASTLFPNGAPPFVQAACDTDPANCFLTFYSTSGIDPLTQQSFVNPRASSHSIFDSDLEAFGAPVVQTVHPTGEEYSTHRVFALNRFNFDAALDRLVPKAVSYSSGMINYFFRGRLDAEQPGPDTLRVKNLSAEEMKGTFALYYDDAQGGRHPVTITACRAGGVDLTVADRKCTDATLASASVDAAARVEVTFDVPVDPAPKTPGEYMLVFSGKLGEETPGEGMVGAVAGKLVGNPYGGVLYLAGQHQSAGVQYFKVTKDGVALLQPGEFNPLSGVTSFRERAYRFKQAEVKDGPAGPVHRTVAVTLQDRFTNGTTSIYRTPAEQDFRRDFNNVTWIADSGDPSVGWFIFRVGNARQLGKQATASYERFFTDAQGQPAQASGSFPLPEFPAITASDYSDFGTGLLTVSADGTEIYPRGEGSSRPHGVRITLAAAPSAALFEVAKGTSSSTENPALSTWTEVGTCSLDYTTRDTDGNPVAASISVPVIRVENVYPDLHNVTTTKTFDGFINGRVLSFDTRVERRELDRSAREGCYLVATDYGGPEPRLKVNNRVKITGERIDRTVTEARLASGAIRHVHEEAGALTRTEPVNCTGSSAGYAFSASGSGTLVDYSYEGFAPCPAITYSIYPVSEIGTPKHRIYRALTDRAEDAIYIDEANGAIMFQGKRLPNFGFLADTSPIGEVFVASLDLTVIEHRPAQGNMPVLTRDTLPPGIISLLAAIWM